MIPMIYMQNYVHHVFNNIRYVVKNINVKVFHLISRTNETRYMKWHETSKCKCRLDASVCNNKQRRNADGNSKN